ncbi:GNAT family N-acetyltransferase [Micromonospora sp. U56]|uniref:GNAT family N-acetyltransferase n=1 Tax=Micromonospora sp. U56 TaxID=2824900 RepID=UPI001B365A59|nr:GNAT family N-acetyltransferase [Micromonospora sp. U56]MBQ0892697.1 GNAT family N-acetyltransferase [Micromonospora sp. U56]
MNAGAIRLRRGQHRQGADVLIASHAAYPAFRHVFPDPRRRLQALRPFFEATVRDAIPFGSVYASTDAGATAAVAVWLPPGAFPWIGTRQARAVPTLIQTMIAAPRSFPTFMRLGSNAARAHPTEPHWYLVVLGVRPRHQGHGHGSRLVTAGLRHADRAGTACYLETSDPDNVTFYQRFGFTIVDDALPLVPGGPTHIAMRRPPVR